MNRIPTLALGALALGAGFLCLPAAAGTASAHVLIARGATAIAWTGGTLPDARYDEFVFQAVLPKHPAGTALHVPVVQEHGKGVHRRIEIPEAGKTADDREPAPSVTLIDKPQDR